MNYTFSPQSEVPWLIYEQNAHAAQPELCLSCSRMQQVFFKYLMTSFYPDNIATHPDVPPHHTRLQGRQIVTAEPQLSPALGLHFMTIRLNRMCVWRGARPAILSAAL